jgi:hypothetical protein
MATMNCAQCKREISLPAEKCPHCGAAVVEPETLSTPPPPRPSQPEHGRMYEIAYRQKLVLYAVLLSFLAFVWGTFVKLFPESRLADIPPALGLVFYLGLIVFCIWSFYKLAVALGDPKLWIWIGAVLLAAPGISIVMLLVTTHRATSALRAAGVRVGLTGANLRTIPKES